MYARENVELAEREAATELRVSIECVREMVAKGVLKWRTNGGYDWYNVKMRPIV